MASNLVETQEIVERSLTPTPPTPEQSRDRYYKRLFQGRLVDLTKPKTSKNTKTSKNPKNSIDSSEKSRIVDSSESKSFEKAECQAKSEETKAENPEQMNVFWTPSDEAFGVRSPYRNFYSESSEGAESQKRQGFLRTQSEETLGADISDPSFDLENSGKVEIQEKGLYETAYDSVMAKIESEAIKAQVHLDKRQQFELFKKRHKEDDKETLGYLQQLDKQRIECPRNKYTTNMVDSIEDEQQQRLWDVACYIRNENRKDELNQGDTSDLYWIQTNLQYLARFDINVWTAGNTKKAKPSTPLSITRSLSEFFSSSPEKEAAVSRVGSLSTFFSAPEAEPSFDGTHVKRRELKFQNKKES